MAKALKKKNSRFDFRISYENREIIESAANLEGLPVSSFATRVLLRESEKIIDKSKKISTIEISVSEAKKFIEALENPPSPNKNLQSAARKFNKKYGQ